MVTTAVMMTVPAPFTSFLTPSPFSPRSRPFQRYFYLLFLPLYQELFHGIFAVMVFNKSHQLLLLFQWRTSSLFVIAFTLPSFLPHLQVIIFCSTVLYSRQIILKPFFFAPLVPRMVDPQQPAHHTRTAQVVHRQIRAALILIFQKRKPFALSRFLVAHEVDMHRFPKLREDR